jgi:hypothetical protein
MIISGCPEELSNGRLLAAVVVELEVGTEVAYFIKLNRL